MPTRKESTNIKQGYTPGTGSFSLSDVLMKEYDGLLSLYTHTENSINSIFNFYVTLLTTITGAIIIFYQISRPTSGNLTWTFLALLVLLVLFGVITQDFLIYKDAELAYFSISINALKEYFLQEFPGAQSHVFFLSNPYSHARVIVNPLHQPRTALEKIEKFFWWMIPLGMPQLFVSLMNSLALTAIFILIIISISPANIPILRLVFTSMVVLGVAYVVQCIYANLKFNSKMTKGHIAMNGKVHPWFQKSDQSAVKK